MAPKSEEFMNKYTKTNPIKVTASHKCFMGIDASKVLVITNKPS